MPSCPPSCPKVKLGLKKLAADRKKALEGGADQSNKYDKENAPKPKVPGQELLPEDFEFGSISRDGHSTTNRRIQDDGKRIDEDYGQEEERMFRGGHSTGSRRTQDGSRKIQDGIRRTDVLEDFNQVEEIGKTTQDGTIRLDEEDCPETASGSACSVGSLRSQDGIISDEKDYYPETTYRGARSRSGKGQDKGSRRKIRGKSLENTSSDFGENDEESRAPGKSGRARGPHLRAYKKAGKRTQRGDSAGYESDRSEDYDPEEYISDQDKDFHPPNHKPCSPTCSLQKLKEEMMRRKLEAKQEAVDDYLLNKGMNYFENLCNCSFKCLGTQLWNDPFVRKMLVSATLFSVGIKLCYEMDAWYIPT